MKNIKFLLRWMGLCVLSFMLGGSALAEEKPNKIPAPSVLVPAPFFQFEPVLEGKDVLHDFIVQNKGDAELEIIKVQPG